jgi:hypothetical protein
MSTKHLQTFEMPSMAAPGGPHNSWVFLYRGEEISVTWRDANTLVLDPGGVRSIVKIERRKKYTRLFYALTDAEIEENERRRRELEESLRNPPTDEE